MIIKLSKSLPHLQFSVLGWQNDSYVSKIREKMANSSQVSYTTIINDLTARIFRFYLHF